MLQADPHRPNVKFIAGHLGVGKSSELLRIRQDLERSGFQILFIDVVEKLDPMDLVFSDLLTALAAELVNPANRQRLGLEVLGGLWSGVSDRLQRVLNSKIELTSIDLDLSVLGTSLGSMTAEIKKNPTKRLLFRDAIDNISTPLLDAINDDLKNGIAYVLKNNGKGVVLIVDGLEKVLLRVLDELAGLTTHTHLFIHNFLRLTSINAHCIYTLPISLLHSPQAAIFNNSAGDFVQPMPMINLRGPDKSAVSDETPGMKIMYAMLDKRCKYAGITRKEAIEPAAASKLCRITGGHPRHLVSLIQAACFEIDKLPITIDAVNKAVRNYANSVFRSLPNSPDYLARLKRFDTPQRDLPADSVHREMLYYLHLYEYLNDQPFYEVNPIFRERPSYVEAVAK